MPPHTLTGQHVSPQSEEKCRRNYPEVKSSELEKVF